MKRLRDWLVFEITFTVLYAAGFLGCAYASKELLTNLVWNDPLRAAWQGCLGVLAILLGVGFLLGISFIIMMSLEVNPEVAAEQRAARKC